MEQQSCSGVHPTTPPNKPFGASGLVHQIHHCIATLWRRKGPVCKSMGGEGTQDKRSSFQVHQESASPRFCTACRLADCRRLTNQPTTAGKEPWLLLLTAVWCQCAGPTMCVAPPSCLIDASQPEQLNVHARLVSDKCFKARVLCV